MGSEWIVTDFADAIDFQEGPGILAKDFQDHGVPLIRLSGLDRGASLLAGCNYLDPKLVEKKWAHFRLQKGDILLSTSASLGRIAVVDDEGVGAIAYTGIIRMRPRDDRLIAPFIRYLLEGPNFQQQVEAFGVGSVIRHFGPMHLRQMTVSIPPLNEQRAIAHILGTLDDKIELNRRQNETLEAMARALFKAWFVDFEPVRAKMEGRWQRGQSLPGLPAHLYDLFPDRLVESELGEIPEGWQLGTIEDLCSSISSGGTPTRKNPRYWSNGTIPWFKTGELDDGPLIDAEEKINETALAESSCKLWPAGTILFALYASPTVGRIGILTAPGTSNQAAAGLMAKTSIGTPFLRRVLIEAREKLQRVAVGAAQQNINQAILKSHKIVLPASGLAEEYSRIVNPWDEKQVEMARGMRSLGLLRDTLLPKLISGELRVPDVDKFMEAMA